MGPSGGQQLNRSDQYSQQQAQNAQLRNQQFDQYGIPIAQNQIPMLEQFFASGGGGPMGLAAQAPVRAQTASDINSIGGRLGGVVSPNALYSDINQQGNTNAALASDAMTQFVSQMLGQYFQGFSGAATSANSQLNDAAATQGQIGSQLQKNQNDMIGSIFSGIGMAAGAGGKSNASQAPTSAQSIGKASPTAVQSFTQAMPYPALASNPYGSFNPIPGAGGGLNTPLYGSKPISSPH